MEELTVSAQRYIEADINRARSLQIAGRAAGTWDGYRRHWAKFSNYLGPEDPWKASPEKVAAWCANMAERGLSPHTIETALSSLNFYYETLGKGFEHGHLGKGVRKESPARSPIVRATVRGIRLVHFRHPDVKQPMMLDTLDKMIDLQPDNMVGIRNKAMLALGWASAARAEELRGLDIESNGKGCGYIEFLDDGVIIILKRSKTNRIGYSWERYAVPRRTSAPRYCPWHLLKTWLSVSGLEEGPLFPSVLGTSAIRTSRMDRHTVNSIIRKGVANLGLDPKDYGSRSLRSGCITWLIKEGVHPMRVMEHSGHRTFSAMLRYVRTVSAVSESALAETRWCS